VFLLGELGVTVVEGFEVSQEREDPFVDGDEKVGKLGELYVCPECGRGVTYMRTGQDPFVYVAISGLLDSGTILHVEGEEFSAECCGVVMERRGLAL
jgi:hypothetical protein